MNWSPKIPGNILPINDAENTVLTKELLRYRTNRGTILPKLIDPKAQKILEIAGKLVETFSASVGNVRETLEDYTKQVLEEFPSNAVVGKGLEKLLLDRTEFDTELNKELIELREKVFRNSSLLLRQNEESVIQGLEKGDGGDLASYQSQMAQAMGMPAEELGDRLYGDLPPFQQVLDFRKMTAEGLLHRYNCAQVQGLLLRCEGMTVTLPESGPAKLRQLLKYLRFNKLLAKITHDQKNKKTLVLEIDGPLSLFVQTQKYGFNLANFFAAILLQPRWELDAEVRIRKNQVHSLHLDQSCGIRSHYRQFLAYVPDEIQLFSQQLSKNLPEWELTSSVDFVPLGGETFCFPDYLLTHSSGKTVSLELFHTWHVAPLRSRLEQLDAQNGAPLLIGINRRLLNNEQLAEQVEASKYFSRHGFFFRDAPTAAKLHPVLEAWIKDRT